MAPKKRQPQKQNPKSKNKKSSSSSSSSAPKLQLSAENENRLRRLLLNNSSISTPSPAPATDSLSKAQKAKRLRALYEKLSCEGFSNDQIEQALSALKDGATFETALDWLCLKLPGNELPLKFSSGTSAHTLTGGSIGVLNSAREDWTPLEDPPSTSNTEAHEFSIKVKGAKDNDTLDSDQQLQADWIRRYMEQEEEDDSESWEGHAADEGLSQKVSKPKSYDEIAKEYHSARLEAAKAKASGDKKSQERAGCTISQLKQELSALGLSDDVLALDFAHKYAADWASDGILETYTAEGPVEAASNDESGLYSAVCMIEPPINDDNMGNGDILMKTSSVTQASHGEEETSMEEVELGDFFLDDAQNSAPLPPDMLKLQKKEKTKGLFSDKNLEGVWKKGEPPKIPKAVLHQLCQRSGWEAPRFDKKHGKETRFSYTVSVVRKASGRGKSRKPGGLITLQLPEQSEFMGSAEDEQNKVAAFALCHLFPDLPIHLMITEPYASLAVQWIEGDQSTKIAESEEDRREDFINSLLNSSTMDGADGSLSEHIDKYNGEENEISTIATEDAENERVRHSKEAENRILRQEQEHRKKMHKYKVFLKARAALPISDMKNEILQLLKENNVIVVCGETGSGKTTQVPQFVLDDMIESGHGGYCNVICTQPRRIAAISVAERVAEERCEASPGCKGSLVGYQVRLDSARNENTKLLFCTTGILLRKIVGNRNLTGVTHVIVDEVHERSLLGDFLLIILKNLLEMQSAQGTSKLKVILMSATVDSDLFSRYFGGCPVITAQGRTYPVETLFLEDVYEILNYYLASDSPASIRNEPLPNQKLQKGPVNNRRGKKNLVLSAWGDDSLLSEDAVNPYYVPQNYQSYSEQTRQNLRKLNEDIIDYDLLEDLVCHIDDTCGGGAILIFLPGAYEIHMLVDKLTASYRFGGPSSDWILPLHSSIAPSDQKKVFLQPPDSIRKVIVATNIAETSITIDDVVYVLDCGKHKENRYNPQKKLTSMVEDWISQANAKQRRGRAGRVKPGRCFCMYTRHRYESIMRPFQAPEMLRMPLVELCLQIKLLSLGFIKPFLSKALEPPKDEAMTTAISLLYEVGAVDGNEELTPLGHHLAKLPVDVLIGKMMLYGAIFGCLSPILSVSAFLSYKSPFIYPKDEKQSVERAKLALLNDKAEGVCDSDDAAKQSDHLVMMVAYRKWDKILLEKGIKAAQHFCSKYYLSSPVMFMIRDMRIQFGTLLSDIGLIGVPENSQIGLKRKDYLDGWFSDVSQPFNEHSHQYSVVKAIICAGLYPNVAATEEGIVGTALSNFKQCSPSVKGFPGWFDGRREVYIHHTSINSDAKAFQYPFMVFLEKVETNKVFLRDTTVVSPYSILLFGGSIDVQHKTGMVVIDGWLKLTAPAQTAVLFKGLRTTLDSVLKALIRNPECVSRNNEVVSSIIHFLLQEEKPLD